MSDTTRRVPPRRTPPARSSAPAADRYREPEDEYPEEQEEQRPQRGRRAPAPDEDERPTRGQRGRRGPAREDEVEDDDAPVLGSGWGAFNQAKAASGGDFPNEYKLPDLNAPPGLFKFLDDAPFTSYAQHWIDDVPGKKSWICVGDDCPLCDIGDSPAAIACFNVVDMLIENAQPAVLALKITAANQIANFAKQPQTKPLDREDLYWAVDKSGTKKSQKTNFRPVKERDLEEDWNCPPITDAELDKLDAKKYTPKSITVHGRAKLQEIADLATGRD